MKIAIKKKGNTELSYIDPTQVKVGERTLGDILDYVDTLESTVQHLVAELQDSTIIRKGDVVGINGNAFVVQDAKVFKNKPKYDLKWYKVVEGELVLDKEKVRKII